MIVYLAVAYILELYPHVSECAFVSFLGMKQSSNNVEWCAIGYTAKSCLDHLP